MMVRCKDFINLQFLCVLIQCVTHCLFREVFLKLKLKLTFTVLYLIIDLFICSDY